MNYEGMFHDVLDALFTSVTSTIVHLSREGVMYRELVFMRRLQFTHLSAVCWTGRDMSCVGCVGCRIQCDIQLVESPLCPQKC